MSQSHPALTLPRQERVDYLTVVASLAAADGRVDAAELESLRGWCRTLGLDVDEEAKVLEAAEHPDAAELQTVVARLNRSPLRFTVIADLLFIAHADGVYDATERDELAGLCEALHVAPHQVSAIEAYVGAALAARGADEEDEHGMTPAAVLERAQVPIGPIALGGSVGGLSGAGVLTGLAALGVGAGVAAGLGVAAAIGLGSFLAIQALHDRVSNGD